MRRTLIVAIGTLVTLMTILPGAGAVRATTTIGGCAIVPGTVCIGATLTGARLAGAQLRRAKLRSTTLRRADLRKADLRGADLRKADLRGADLRGADLRRADLRRANLRGARLAGARLTGANLAGALLPPGLGMGGGGSGGTGSTGGSSSGSSGSSGSSTSSLPDPTSLILPYASGTDLERIGPRVSQAYATANPSFSFHNGIDFIANRDLVAFRAMSDAIVLAVEVVPNGANEQVAVRVDAGGGFTIVYGFEPMAGAVGQSQLAQINVRVGDRLQPGTVLGRLLKPGPDAAHLHVHMQPSGTNDAICFADRWSAADQAAATAKLSGGYTQLCYG